MPSGRWHRPGPETVRPPSCRAPPGCPTPARFSTIQKRVDSPSCAGGSRRNRLDLLSAVRRFHQSNTRGGCHLSATAAVASPGVKTWHRGGRSASVHGFVAQLPSGVLQDEATGGFVARRRDGRGAATPTRGDVAPGGSRAAPDRRVREPVGGGGPGRASDGCPCPQEGSKRPHPRLGTDVSTVRTAGSAERVDQPSDLHDLEWEE